jgi:hypothetical protein
MSMVLPVLSGKPSREQWPPNTVELRSKFMNEVIVTVTNESAGWLIAFVKNAL